MRLSRMVTDERGIGAISLGISLISLTLVGFLLYGAWDFWQACKVDGYSDIATCVAGKAVDGVSSTVGGWVAGSVTGLFQWGMKIGGRDPEETGEDSPSWWPNFLPW